MAKQAEKEEEKVRRKQERLVRLREGPKHTFDDRTYTAQIQANAEQIGDALQQGTHVWPGLEMENRTLHDMCNLS